MLHLLKYSFLSKVRNFNIIFWPLVFPLVLGTFFYFAFGNINEADFQTVPVAVVKKDTADTFFLTYLDQVEKSSPDLLKTEEMPEKEALEALQDKQHHHQQRSHNDNQLAHGKAPSFPVLVFPKYSGYRPPLSRKRGCFSQIVQLCGIFRPRQAARQSTKLAQKAPPSEGIFLGQSQPRTRAPRSRSYQISSRLSAARSLFLQRHS